MPRATCARCGKSPATATWNICADGNRQRRLCPTCDVALNRMVLRWVGVKDWQKKIARYRAQNGAAGLAV